MLEQTDGQLGFAGGGAGLWPVTRYLALLLGDDAAAVVELPGCSPVLEQTDGQLGFAGGGAGL
ncbi:hypothetical protein C0U44_31450, partial [Klebsiella pneumoniae]